MKKVLCCSLAALCLVLTGCPDTGVICATGTVRCGAGCADPSSDSRNCGACGNACRSGQICNDSSCVCSAGTFPCDGECVVRETDPKNCGVCGNACGPTQVCEKGLCQANCVLGTSTRCGASCANLQTDATNCGACGVSCENSQSCKSGRCSYDLVLACYSSGQVTGLQAKSEFKGPAEPMGTAPAALASFGDVLLTADGIDKRLYQARLQSVGGHAFALYPRVNRTGAVPNQVLVAPPYVYVVNAGSGTLQVLQQGGTPIASDAGPISLGDAGVVDGGLDLATVAELPLGLNTFPQGAAKLGNALWVPLYGGYGADSVAGQKVLRIDITNPLAPAVTGSVDLATINLRSFDGGAPVARPYAVTVHRGAVYVALNNLNPDTYVAEGPGMLVKINPASLALTEIDLGADKCLDAVWLASDGERLLVSCVGNTVYSGPPNYELLSTDKAAVVMLDSQDVRRSVWTPSCPVGADGGAGCSPILLGRFALTGGRAYLGDGNNGRLFVLDVTDAGLLERRGYFGDAGQPIAACAVDPITNIANVTDVLAIP